MGFVGILFAIAVILACVILGSAAVFYLGLSGTITLSAGLWFAIIVCFIITIMIEMLVLFILRIEMQDRREQKRIERQLESCRNNNQSIKDVRI